MFVCVIHGNGASPVREKKSDATTSECSLKDAALFKGNGNRSRKLAHSLVSLANPFWLREAEMFNSFTRIPDDVFGPLPSCRHLNVGAVYWQQMFSFFRLKVTNTSLKTVEAEVENKGFVQLKYSETAI